VDQKRPAIVANLKNVSYIDSSGLATFIEAYQKLMAYDGKLVLCHLNDTVRGVFEIARLEDVLSIVPTETDALQQVKS
jgi:anti-sigma B factor antagonist